MYGSAAGRYKKGLAYLIFGKANYSTPTVMTLPDDLDGTNGVVIRGENCNSCSFGHSVTALGDVNNDTIADFGV